MSNHNAVTFIILSHTEYYPIIKRNTMDTYIFLQHYWWFIVSLLGAILVFLLFVQGGNSLLFCLGKTEEQKKMMINSTGRKWELSFY